MSSIQDLAAQGGVRSLDNLEFVGPEDPLLADIDAAADFRGGLRLGRVVVVAKKALIGAGCELEGGNEIGERVYLGDNVHIGENAAVDPDAFLEDDVVVGPGAIVGRGTLIAAGLEVAEGSDIAPDRVIPGRDMLQRYGPAGPLGEYFTIYPGDDGPYINIDGKEEPLVKFEQRMDDRDTPSEVAIDADLVKIVSAIAYAGQTRYDRALANGIVATLRARKAALQNP